MLTIPQVRATNPSPPAIEKSPPTAVAMRPRKNPSGVLAAQLEKCASRVPFYPGAGDQFERQLKGETVENPIAVPVRGGEPRVDPRILRGARNPEPALPLSKAYGDQ